MERSKYKVSRPSMLTATVRDYDYRVGWITTPHGLVGLYHQGPTSKHPLTDLSVVRDGRRYSVRWDREFSDRYLKTLATRFAADPEGFTP